MKFTLLLLVLLPFIVLAPTFFAITPSVYAATTPSLGEAAGFGILSSTYTNTIGVTTINGDLGYTTPPAAPATVNGDIYTPPDPIYTQAGIDQGAALSALNAQPCDFNFGSATDLSLLSQPLIPGVYCIDGATSIGTGGITLSGSGTYIFRMDGALTTDANSVVALAGGASSCDVFWTPTQATTLGANSTFIGTNIDDSGITIGSNVIWEGRALAFGETVSTEDNTITVPTCDSPTPTPAPTGSTPAPTGSDISSTTSSGGSSAGGISCPAFNSIAPIITESRRVDMNSVFISWGPYSGIDTFIVSYGLENGNWLYNTHVTGFSTTLNALPQNLPIWVQVAATNDCSIGAYGEAKLVGAPSLPNTGFVSQNNNIFWHILRGIFVSWYSIPTLIGGLL